MPYDVSSSFIHQSRSKTPDVVRKFTIAGSDFSDRILKWPRFSRSWDDIRPKNLKLKLANGDEGMNFLRSDKTKMQNECIISMGVGDNIDRVINGGFDTDTDWTKGTNWTIASGVAHNSGLASSDLESIADITVEAGTTYVARLTVSNFSSGIVGFSAVSGITSGIPVTWWSGNGEYELAFTPLASGKLNISQASFAGDIDDVSVRQIETIDLFSGKIRGTKYSKEDCSLTIVDKFQQLSDRQVGTSDEPVDYTTSNYLPSDLAWWAVTSYGGYSTVTSTNNPDIDYEAFNDWAAVFSGDSVLMRALFDGQKVTEILRKIARQTHSAIFIKENKLSFHRFGIADANVSSLGPSDIINMDLSFDTNDIINKQYVAGDYSVESEYHQFTVLDASTASVNSFGAKENTLKDEGIWYVDSGSALNLAQRKILANADPDDSIDVEAGLVGLPRLIGETIMVQDAFHGIAESYRILEHEIDMDRGRSKFRIDRTQLTGQFILDTTSLGSTTEVLT